MSEFVASLLFVDDEKKVLNSMRAMFRREYNVHLANSGEEALQVVRTESVDVIVSDQRMPGLTGVEVLREVKQIAPKIMRILLTGYADLEAIEGSINDGEVFRFLSKPCPPDQLKEVVALAASIARESPPVSDSASAADSEPDVAPAAPKAPRPPKAHVERQFDSEIVVLSADDSLLNVVRLGGQRASNIRRATTVEETIALLNQHPVGVLVTDVAIDRDDVQALTSQLKAVIPELVTIVVSERSDARKLIDLINYGQIFRFLLKPVSRGQCKVSVESALRKHQQLLQDPSLAQRHQVNHNPNAPSAIALSTDRIRSRFNRLRTRLFGRFFRRP